MCAEFLACCCWSKVMGFLGAGFEGVKTGREGGGLFLCVVREDFDIGLDLMKELI